MSNMNYTYTFIPYFCFTMRLKKSYNIDELRDYSSLFSRNEILKLYSNDFTSIKGKIERYGYTLKKRKQTYLSFLKHAYSILEKFYPNEYIYKNEFLNKWLIEKVGLKDSLVYNEFRLGKAVADLVMFNGNSKVFEIKTLLDNDSRLSNQLKEYSKVFNEVYVVVPYSKLNKYFTLSEKIGLISYNECYSEFNLERKAKINLEIDVDILMEILHTKEYLNIVENYFKKKVECNDFNRFEICKELMNQIPFNFLNSEFVRLMKLRRRNNDFSINDKELNQIFLSLNYNIKNRESLLNNLRTSIN